MKAENASQEVCRARRNRGWQRDAPLLRGRVPLGYLCQRGHQRGLVRGGLARKGHFGRGGGAAGGVVARPRALCRAPRHRVWQSIDKRKSRMDDLSILLTRTHVGLSVLEERIAVVPQIMQRGHLLPTPEYLPSVWPPIGNRVQP